MSDIILEAKNLTKSFDDITAVDNLDLSIRKGEVVGLLGVNGAGKSTCMQMLLGLIKPTSGTIHIFGKDFEKKADMLKEELNSPFAVHLAINEMVLINNFLQT